MKNLMNFYLFGLIFIALSSCNKETVLPLSKVPAEIKNYISTHFPDYSIVKVVEDNDKSSKTYEVILENNIRLEFNQDLQIIDIDAKTKLPDSVIPEKIRDYVTANYPTQVITNWEIEGINQHVELDNDIELEFSMAGDFIRIVD